MGKWLDKKIIVISISAGLGLLLSGYVYQRQNFWATQSQSASVNTIKTIHNVPVRVLDTSNQKYVSGMTETIAVSLEGPRNILTQLTEKTFYVQTEDIAVLEAGERELRLNVVGLPSNVIGTLAQTVVPVEISQQKQIVYDVAVRVDESVIAKGYEMGEVAVLPKQVTLVGKLETINAVASVTAHISSEDTKDETFTIDNVPVIVRDAQQNVLDVQVKESVSVTIPVYKSGMKVPVEITLAGQQDGYEYKMIHQDVRELIVLAGNTKNENINKITATANVSQLTSTGTIEATVLVPTHVTISNPQPIKVTVEVVKK